VNFPDAVATELANPSGRPIDDPSLGASIHSAIRRALGIEEDWPLTAYRNHLQLEPFVHDFYQALNAHLGARVDLSLLRKSIDLPVVLDLLHSLGRNSKFENPPAPVIRPGLKRVQGSGKYRSVIAAEVAAIAFVQKRDFADVLGDFLVPGESNSEMVNRIDRSVVVLDNDVKVDWKLAKDFSSAVATWTKNSESSFVTDFCFSLLDEWSGVTDSELRDLLKPILSKPQRVTSGNG
jgi:hypothetical protein